MVRLVPAVVGVISAGAITKTLFDTNLQTFLFGRPGPSLSAEGSYQISLQELLFHKTAGASQSSFDAVGGLGGIMARNMRVNWMSAVPILIGTVAVPKIISKMGINRNINKSIKALGMGGLFQM